ncbi:GDSL-type esterase/lipase family protein [Dokdonia sp.]|uniref:GDSL-type esterase/lipase family protein n=1 Tax=Dokdonia sp. TaxID=2024995 RepID=UPI0032664A41
MDRERIVCIGDSLTAGYGVQIIHAWPHLLSQDLHIEVMNSGISGDTTSGMLARFQDMVIKHKPTHTIIMGGTNDLSLQLPNNILISNILAMTRYAKHHGIIPIIGIPTPFYNQEDSIDEYVSTEVLSLSKRIQLFQRTLKQFAIDDGLDFIDFTVGMTPKLFLEDGLHPNEEGHILMFENAKSSLLKFLNHI